MTVAYGVCKLIVLTSRRRSRSTRLSTPLLMGQPSINHINTDDCKCHHYRAHDCCMYKQNIQKHNIVIASLEGLSNVKCSLIPGWKPMVFAVRGAPAVVIMNKHNHVNMPPVTKLVGVKVYLFNAERQTPFDPNIMNGIE